MQVVIFRAEGRTNPRTHEAGPQLIFNGGLLVAWKASDAEFLAGANEVLPYNSGKCR